jgi:hypothetical protein
LDPCKDSALFVVVGWNDIVFVLSILERIHAWPPLFLTASLFS